MQEPCGGLTSLVNPRLTGIAHLRAVGLTARDYDAPCPFLGRVRSHVWRLTLNLSGKGRTVPPSRPLMPGPVWIADQDSVNRKREVTVNQRVSGVRFPVGASPQRNNTIASGDQAIRARSPSSSTRRPGTFRIDSRTGSSTPSSFTS